jgi:O-antigen/teichoic acid export membrane protein
MQGGMYLALRQAIGMLVAVGGTLLLTRLLGPGVYGLYAAALGVYFYTFSLSQWGIAVYLIRKEGELQEQDYHQAFLLFAVIGAAAAILCILVIPVVDRWLRLDGFRPVALALCLVVPLDLLSLAPLARLERALDYRRVALIEVVGQLAFYLLALPLALLGAGVWAPVVGWWAKEVLVLVMLYQVTGYHPQLYWNWRLVKEMLSYGLGYSGSVWVWQLRSLVNPLVVGRFMGAEAVGYIALTVRLADYLGFVRNATYRLSIAGLARVQGDRGRLTNAIREGMALQILALGPILVIFGWIAPWLVPMAFGRRWETVIQIYPFIALGYLSNAMFNLHSSALYTLKRNWDVTVFHLVHIVLFCGSAILLLPRIGVIGYGVAEVIALPSFLVIGVFVLRTIGTIHYRLATVWWIGLALPLFWQTLGSWTCLALLAATLWPGTLRELKRYMGYVTCAYK